LQEARNAAGIGYRPAQSPFRQTLLHHYDTGHYNDIELLPCRYSSFDNPALDNVKVNNPTMVEDLLRKLISGESTKRLVTLLAVMAKAAGGANNTNPPLADLAFKPVSNNPQTAVAPSLRLEKMLQVSSRIHQFLETNPLGEEVVKFKLIISYTMLYLTLEKGIVPSMQASDPSLGPQYIDRNMMRVFQEHLKEYHGIELKQASLKEKIRYGKVFWEMVKLTGVLILPMLAVAGPGISLFTHQFGVLSNNIPVLATRLAECTVWMSLCQALSTVAVELIFTSSCPTYSVSDLLGYLALEPLSGRSTQLLYTYILQDPDFKYVVPAIRRYRMPAGLTHQSASKILSEFGLSLTLFPQNKFPHPQSQQVKFVEWLILQDEQESVELAGDPTVLLKKKLTIKLAAFTSFLEPGLIADDVIDFLSALWNQRELPGWAMISPSNTMKVLAGEWENDPKWAFTLAAGGRRFNIPFQFFVLPMATDRSIFPLVVSIKEKTATLFVLAGLDQCLEYADQLLQVSHLVH